jgi:hypothetical protein
MSEHSKILEKYEKMFEDGSAYKPIRLSQPQPNMAEITGAVPEEKPNIPLGEQVNRDNFQNDVESDYSEADAYMEGKINEMRTKVSQGNNPNVNVQNDVMKRVLKRLDLLEQALTLVMETQSKLIKG